MRLLAFLVVLAFAPTGYAQQTPADADADVDAADLDQAARLLFESASRAYEAGNFTDALARYTNAFELSGRAPLMYNIAICHDRLDQKEAAADFYERFVAEVPDSPRVGIARSRAEILRASLVQVEAPTEEVDVDAQDTDLDTQAPHGQPAPESSRSLAGPIASFAIGGAGLVTFVVAGLISNARYSDAEEACNAGVCTEATLDDVDRVSLIADVGLGLAIAGTAVGVVWLLVGGGDDERDESAARFAPVASPSTLGGQVTGSF